ncbi:uncharacterized protein LOC131857568 [Cryptomeria japonica]|uniref:uncharacterized protein LOC131857568 n=1 Tax=Cryptomeria japonica TaxID=3369 RepID=UPI0027DA953F|nr:uncharacterized protein LOC131857568 [Cryptomeria japonica]
MIEQPTTEAQPSSATTTTTTMTTTTPTTTTTSSARKTPTTTSTASVEPNVTTMPPPLVTTMVTPPSVVSHMPMLAMTPTTKTIIIHNVDLDSDQVEVEPTLKKEKQQGEAGEMGQTQDVEHDERLVLTPQDVENLLKDIIGGEAEQQGPEPTKDFNKQLSERLE